MRRRGGGRHARATGMSAARRAAVLLVAAGVVATGAGAVGLVLTRHPDVPRAAALQALPVPTGPIEAAPAQAAAEVAEPASLVIPSIGVSTSLVRLGLTSTGALQVPPTTAVAGWYTGSPRPGAIGSAVIAGHIDSVAGPGVFYRLSQLQRGDRVYVRRADGTLAVFAVTQVQSYPKDDFPTTAVYGAVPDPELRLITCGGTFDYSTRSYLSNTVVYAKEVS
jgi:LPXTG-site transpeptidase (sortase) family protein